MGGKIAIGLDNGLCIKTAYIRVYRAMYLLSCRAPKSFHRCIRRQVESNPICTTCKAERRLGAFSKVNFLALLKVLWLCKMLLWGCWMKRHRNFLYYFLKPLCQSKIISSFKNWTHFAKMVWKLGQTVEYEVVVGTQDSALCLDRKPGSVKRRKVQVMAQSLKCALERLTGNGSAKMYV